MDLREVYKDIPAGGGAVGKEDRLIPLTRGMFALVDIENYPELSRHKWHAKDSGRSYAARTVRNGSRKNILMHREILNPLPGFLADHINGNTLDNRRSNLRIVNYKQNACNRRKHKECMSVFKGVWRSATGRWTAEIKDDGVRKYLGTFESEVKAAVAYDRTARELFGDYACLNFNRILSKRWIRRYFNSTKGRMLSVYFRKRSNGMYRWMTCRTQVKKGQNGSGPIVNELKHKLISVYDMHKCEYRYLGIDGIEAIKFAGTSYVVC